MVAETRDLDSVFFGSLEYCEVGFDLVGFVVDEHLDLFWSGGRGGGAEWGFEEVGEEYLAYFG